MAFKIFAENSTNVYSNTDYPTMPTMSDGFQQNTTISSMQFNSWMKVASTVLASMCKSTTSVLGPASTVDDAKADLNLLWPIDSENRALSMTSYLFNVNSSFNNVNKLRRFTVFLDCVFDSSYVDTDYSIEAFATSAATTSSRICSVGCMFSQTGRNPDNKFFARFDFDIAVKTSPAVLGVKATMSIPDGNFVLSVDNRKFDETVRLRHWIYYPDDVDYTDFPFNQLKFVCHNCHINNVYVRGCTDDYSFSLVSNN